MTYPGYDAKTKLEIVKRIWKGAKVASLSRRFGISRDSFIDGLMKLKKMLLNPLHPLLQDLKLTLSFI